MPVFDEHDLAGTAVTRPVSTGTVDPARAGASPDRCTTARMLGCRSFDVRRSRHLGGHGGAIANVDSGPFKGDRSTAPRFKWCYR